MFTLRKKAENMSKKPVTIPQVDEAVYLALKNKAAEQKQSVSELVNKLMSSYIEGNNNTPDNSEELDSLRGESEQLKSELALYKAKQEETAAENDKLYKQLSILQVENAKAKEVITELSEAKQKWEEHYNEAKNANETLTAMRANTVQVELSELEFALINYVSEKEQKRRRNDVTITPALLLKTMFVEYCLNGETWFFPFPKRSEIKALKDKLKKQEE